MSEQKWNKIGDVVGAAGGSEATSGKKLYQVRLRGTVLYREGIYTPLDNKNMRQI